jgi:hypothetical protein
MRKIQWALYRNEDVSAFRAEISVHLNSIQVLLLSACRFVVIVQTVERLLILIELRLQRREKKSWR